MRKHVVTAALVCLPVALVGWQSGMASIGVTEAALQSQFERATRQKGDGLMLSILPPKALVAAKALSEPMQVALMRELATTAKTIMMSPAFQSAHDAFIATEYKAVNHGIKVKTLEDSAKAATSKAGANEFELKMKREMAAIYVQFAMDMKIADLTMMLDEGVKDWTKQAAKPKANPKYAKLLKQAAAIKDSRGVGPGQVPARLCRPQVDRGRRPRHRRSAVRRAGQLAERQRAVDVGPAQSARRAEARAHAGGG